VPVGLQSCTPVLPLSQVHDWDFPGEQIWGAFPPEPAVPLEPPWLPGVPPVPDVAAPPSASSEPHAPSANNPAKPKPIHAFMPP
jgi:hypothetical protein